MAHTNEVRGAIIRSPNSTFWAVMTMDEFGVRDERHFIYPEAAFDFWRKYEAEAYRRIRGRELIHKIDGDLLSFKERIFVAGMYRKNCRGITIKQYGYLKGLYERHGKE